MSSPEIRVGQGFDIHRFSDDPTRPLILGGVTFEGSRGLVGHSDADAVAHAVTDALLGAAGLGDIGEHFPDTDPAWKGADSMRLLAETVALIRAAGWTIANVDSTVILQRPKLKDFREPIRANIARLLGLELDQVSVKFKTAEKVGPVGEGKSAEAQAIVTLFH